ncbi:MAG TPA: glycine cleavage T C-terminal barrel domain-containing protein [bacterium]|nr:glycine cleavage T C-terminal barrel domain-containing protein [bacterium]
MGYVPKALAKSGTPVDVDIRGKAARATIVKLPFYKRTAG